jgi:hypothetical protein
MGKILRIALLFASFFICASSMAQTGGTVIKGRRDRRPAGGNRIC